MKCQVDFMHPKQLKYCSVRQIQSCATGEVYAKHKSSSDSSISQHMGEFIGKRILSAVVRSVMHREERKLFSLKREICQVQSIVECVQSFSYKSKISLAAGSLILFSLQITLSNITEAFRRHCTLSRASVVGQRLVSLEDACARKETITYHGERYRL